MISENFLIPSSESLSNEDNERLIRYVFLYRLDIIFQFFFILIFFMHIRKHEVLDPVTVESSFKLGDSVSPIMFNLVL